MSTQWFAVRKELPPHKRTTLAIMSFIIPLLIWSLVSYVPFIWHPQMEISDPGAVSYFKEGMLVEGTITHLTKFGAFARIGDELEGLIHVSELKEERVAHPKEVVKEGEKLTLRIIKIDPERHRIGLSLENP